MISWNVEFPGNQYLDVISVRELRYLIPNKILCFIFIGLGQGLAIQPLRVNSRFSLVVKIQKMTQIFNYAKQNQYQWSY